jgi:hypothetical protein
MNLDLARQSCTLKEVQLIEEELNTVQFLGIPMGGLSAQFIYSNIYFHPYQSSLRNLITNIILNIREQTRINLISKENIGLPIDSKKIVFNISANLQKNIAFFTGLHAKLNNDYQCIIISKENIPFHIYSSDSYFSYKNLTLSQFIRWKKEYGTIKSSLSKTLSQLKKKFSLTSSFIEELKFNIKRQTKAIIYFDELLLNIKPDIIISDHDRHGINSALIEAANRLKIPTFTFIHGSTFPPDHYYPILAKFMICWGNDHKKQFMALGVPEERLIVCGNQKINRSILSDSKIVKQKFGYTEQDEIVILATNVIPADQRLQYADDFCISIKSSANLKGMIRIHPSEKIEEYKTIIEKHPEIKFVDNDMLSFDESMAISDYVVCHNSLYGLDALIKRKKVILFAPAYITFPLGIGKELHEKAGCPLILNITELIEYFRVNTSSITQTTETAEAYIHSYILAFGEDADVNICREILVRSYN